MLLSTEFVPSSLVFATPQEGAPPRGTKPALTPGRVSDCERLQVAGDKPRCAFRTGGSTLKVGEQYSPLEWQQHFFDLLPFMHGIAHYTRVPDVDLGDAGLEAFSDDGNAYQCFADQGSNTLTQRYEKQRNKITVDLKKFSNVAKVAPIVGDQKIARWVLVVPRSDTKKLTAFCNKKTKEIRALNLPYVAADFKVTVVDQTDLRSFERQSTVALIRLQAGAVDAGDAAERVKTLLPNLEKKLLFVYPDDVERNIRREKLLVMNAVGENFLQDLRDAYPQTYESVRSAIRSREQRLVAVGPANQATPRDVFDAELNDLEEVVRRDNGLLDAANRTTIVIGAVTDWLLRCPLDFDHVRP